MCIVSMVHDFNSKLPLDIWDWDKVKEYEYVIEELDKVDKKLGLPECDPNKGEFLEMVKARLRKLDEEKKALEQYIKVVS